MGIVDPEIFPRTADFFRSIIRVLFDPRFDWTEDAESIMSWLKYGGATEEELRRLRPYFSYFVQGVIDGEISEDYPVVDNPGLSHYPPRFSITELLSNRSSESSEGPSEASSQESNGRGDAERALIDQLIAATKLYNSGGAVKELFEFIIKLREFAPFNAMILNIQKPGLTHAATAQDWHKRFGRVPKKGTRPLLVLRTKGPVDFVFDILDTEGRDVPVDAFAFPTFGNLTDNRFTEFMRSVKKERIDVVALDAGDGQAGWIRLLAASKAKTGKNLYQLAYNRNHDAATRFVTVAHELAHLYLGHLGLDAGRRVPDRRDTPHALMEVEAEMAAYLVAMRNGLKPRSESYLANYKGAFEDLNLYAVTRAANAVETAMGISAQKLWNEKA